jgi:hypothetical protein
MKRRDPNAPRPRTLTVLEQIVRSDLNRVDVTINSNERGAFAAVTQRVRRYDGSKWFALRSVSLFGAAEARAVGNALIEAAELLEDEDRLEDRLLKEEWS